MGEGRRGTAAAGKAGKRDWFCAPRDVTAPEKNESRGERNGMEWGDTYLHTGERGESVMSNLGRGGDAVESLCSETHLPVTNSQQCPLKHSVRNFQSALFNSVLRIEALDSCKSNAARGWSFFSASLLLLPKESRTRRQTYFRRAFYLSPRPLHAFQFICIAFIVCGTDAALRSWTMTLFIHPVESRAKVTCE